MKLHLALLLVPIIFIAGCAGIGDIFGGNIVTINTIDNVNGQRDILAIRSIETIPNSPVLPDFPVLLSFIVENQDKFSEAKDAKVDLFDAPIFRKDDPAKPLCNSAPGTCPPESQQGVAWCTAPCNILPGEQKQVNFYLQAPSDTDIAGIRTTAAMNFKVSYDYNARLTYLIPIVNRQEILKRQISGEKLSVQESKSHSSGPIQVDASVFGPQYILGGQNAQIIFKLRNVGSGEVKNNKIDIGKMKISFPADILDVSKGGKITPPSDFTAVTATEFENSKPIEIFKDESRRSILFTLTGVNDLSANNEPFKTFEITASIGGIDPSGNILPGYTYEIKDSTSLDVNPFRNV
ncbi:MAG TPA: hypothetical protein VI968_03280 [archaeon]|nr:hypothetical protein [archaeon]